MKVLLVGINSSYVHTCLAIRSIKNYVEFFAKKEKQDFFIDFIEFTINQPIMEIFKSIFCGSPDVLLFSTYIWNGPLIEKIISEIKKILPSVLIGAGGPEFSYGWKKYFNNLSSLDFIMFGEGEKNTYELLKDMNLYKKNNPLQNYFLQDKQYVSGIYYKKNNEIIFTGLNPLIKDLDSIPFSYPELLSNNYDADNKIYYYESSRGCPYSCSYCLSSVDKQVRFKSIEKVFTELDYFLKANVKLVKFVDRTYNLNPERYIKIWQYILKNHNQKTMFHFEIEAEYLSKEALEFLQTVPYGIMQFEIGVQTANKKALKAINRSTNIEILAENIKQIPRTIHQHLDLIAGLPFEDLDSFGKSFDFVMELKPDALQLGFLKVLSGTQMEKYATENGWKYQENPVYEVFSTPYLTFQEISFLKEIEVLVDAFWNKSIFSNTMKFIFRKVSPWTFFYNLCIFAKSINSFQAARKELYWFQLLNDFIEKGFVVPENSHNEELLEKFQDDYFLVLYNLLKYDFVLTGKKGNFPNWYIHHYNKEKHRILLEKNKMLHSTRLAFALSEFETFDFDVKSEEPEKYKGCFEYLIQYKTN